MIAQSVFSSLVSQFIILIVGYILRKKNIIDEHITRGLSRILTTAGVSAMVLASMQQQTYSPEGLQSIVVVGLGVIVMVLTGGIPALLICKLRRVPLAESGAWIGTAAFSNAMFMVRPIIVNLYGDAANFALIGVLIAFNLTAFSLGIVLMNLGKEGGVSVRMVLKALVNPALISSLVGIVLFVFSIRLPAPVIFGLSMLMETTSPLSMIIIGSLLAAAPLKELFTDRRVYLLSSLRLIVSPLLTFVIIRQFVQDPMLLTLIVLISAMPTATTMAVFAEMYDNHSLLCSKTVFLSTMLSLFTIPAISMLL